MRNLCAGVSDPGGMHHNWMLTLDAGKINNLWWTFSRETFPGAPSALADLQNIT